MKIPVPRWYDRAMDAIACAILPPAKPIGLAVRGHDVTWLDLALVVYPTIGAIALWWWTGSWLWLPAVAGSMALAVVTLGWR